MGAAPTAFASRKNASSRPCPLRLKPSCLRIPSGAATTHPRTLSCMAPTVSLCLRADASRTHHLNSSKASTRRRRKATSNPVCINSLHSRWGHQAAPARSAQPTSRTLRRCLRPIRARKRSCRVTVRMVLIQIRPDSLNLVRRLLLLLPRSIPIKHLSIRITTSLRLRQACILMTPRALRPRHMRMGIRASPPRPRRTAS